MQEDLNPEQRHAVKIIDYPLIITAGPGTGKTKTLVAKIIYLIKEKRIKPEEILALTFTRKAAREIYERVGDVINRAPTDVITFHALALKILKTKKRKNEIIDEKTQKEIVEKIISKKEIPEHIKSLSTREILLNISRIKNGSKSEISGIEKVERLYTQELKDKKLYDYDDIILQAKKLLGKKTVKMNYKYILVDEFQDTNQMQYELVKLLIKCHPLTPCPLDRRALTKTEKSAITVIGDPKQSIYGFRGATGNIFDKFKKDFAEFKQIELKTNYRSAQEIINSAYKLFPKDKPLKAFQRQKGEVRIIETLNQYTQADWIIDRISRIVGGTNLNESSDMQNMEEDIDAGFKDFAVIYRTHGLSRELEKKFYESGIPYQIVGPGSFFTRKEVEFLISNLKEYSHLQEKFPACAEEIVEASKLWKNLSERRKLEMNEFINSLERFTRYKNPYEKFIEYIEKLESQDYYNEESDKVTLLTMHAAKGLEFKYIFIINCEEGIVPFLKNKNIEEEKRLFFVAMTRAKNSLNIIYTKECRRKSAKPSEFLDLIKSDEIRFIKDERIIKTIKRRERQKAKKAQFGFQLGS